jgi:hypothetical protein
MSSSLGEAKLRAMLTALTGDREVRSHIGNLGVW